MESFDTVILISLLYSTAFLLFGEYTQCYLYRPKNNKLRNQRRSVFDGFFCHSFLSAWCVLLVAKLYALGYVSFIDVRNIPAMPLWYASPVIFLYVVRLIIFKLSAKKKIRVAIIGITDNGLAAERAAAPGSMPTSSWSLPSTMNAARSVWASWPPKLPAPITER
ncbi:Uncharacterised protein [Leclercia adecarboxylata]|uniref:Uncharacterized protein n=1 Tax=Leclercia adecarboxylata TaxID=83655 RepID=A0A4U9HFS8_9ENTR|nr:Uncharacterised protein [Leclercia adecarboxylata]